MKRINQYFSGGCVAFTVLSAITIIMHILDKQDAIKIKSQMGMLLIIILVQTVLYLMENVGIRSQIGHMALELSVIAAVTFAIGIPIRLVEVSDVYSVIRIVLIIALAYGITSLSLYINGISAANEINRHLQRK